MTKATVEFREPQTPMPNGEGKGLAQTRLKREGRWEKFCGRRNWHHARLTSTKKWTRSAATDESWALTLLEFPPLPEDQLPPVIVKKAVPWTPPSLAAVEPLFMQLPPALRSNLDEAYLWVFNHPALSRTPGPEGVRYLKPEDFPGCPSQGAWTLLSMAMEDTNSFRKEFMQRFSKPEKAVDAAADQGVQDDGLDDLDALLEQARAG